MTKAEALDIVRKIRIVAQRNRSIYREELERQGYTDDDIKFLAETLALWNNHPDMGGESPILTLATSLEDNFTAMGFYNLLYMANRDDGIVLLYGLGTGEKLPEPSMEILQSLM